jgi:hypothetical protein
MWGWAAERPQQSNIKLLPLAAVSSSLCMKQHHLRVAVSSVAYWQAFLLVD